MPPPSIRTRKVIVAPGDHNSPHGQLLSAVETGDISTVRNLLAPYVKYRQRQLKSVPNRSVSPSFSASSSALSSFPPNTNSKEEEEDDDDDDDILDIECITKVNHETPLAVACLEDQTVIVDYLLSIGANPNTNDSDGNTPLIYCDNPRIVRSLIQAGANVHNQDNETGETPLFLAYVRNDPEVAYVLLTEGKSNVNIPNKQGDHVLDIAVQRNDIEWVSLLLKHGADTRLRGARPQGQYPLHVACSTGNLDLVLLLLENGGQFEEKDLFGITPLMVASFHGHVEIVRLLMNHGCHLWLVDQHGKTAIEYALQKKHDLVVTLLESFCRIRKEYLPYHHKDIITPRGKVPKQPKPVELFPVSSPVMKNVTKQNNLSPVMNLSNHKNVRSRYLDSVPKSSSETFVNKSIQKRLSKQAKLQSDSLLSSTKKGASVMIPLGSHPNRQIEPVPLEKRKALLRQARKMAEQRLVELRKTEEDDDDIIDETSNETVEPAEVTIPRVSIAQEIQRIEPAVSWIEPPIPQASPPQLHHIYIEPSIISPIHYHPREQTIGPSLSKHSLSVDSITSTDHFHNPKANDYFHPTVNPTLLPFTNKYYMQPFHASITHLSHDNSNGDPSPSPSPHHIYSKGLIRDLAPLPGYSYKYPTEEDTSSSSSSTRDPYATVGIIPPNNRISTQYHRDNDTIEISSSRPIQFPLSSSFLESCALPVPHNKLLSPMMIKSPSTNNHHNHNITNGHISHPIPRNKVPSLSPSFPSLSSTTKLPIDSADVSAYNPSFPFANLTTLHSKGSPKLAPLSITSSILLPSNSTLWSPMRK